MVDPQVGVGGRGAVMSLRVTRAGARVAFGDFLVVVGIEILVVVAVATLESNALARARVIAESLMLLVYFLGFAAVVVVVAVVVGIVVV